MAKSMRAPRKKNKTTAKKKITKRPPPKARGRRY